ncbi:MAG: NADPH-dependent FMN reductase [Segniliparus sp.]|uniref:NADPH-dependent FMN reductase n=1 Tax=Segniliparus sp. TaxID=2804064 RepID=UPI003F2C1D28
MTNVLVLVGSVRTGSVNQKLAQVAVDGAPEGVSVQIYPGLELLPHFNQDLEEPPLPEEVARFKEAVGAADALLLVTPAYNGAPSAVLKNGIDWASRPYGSGPIANKPVAVIGAANNPQGGPQSIGFASAASTIAGGKVLEETVFAAIRDLPDGEPSKDPQVVDGVKAVLAALASAAQV